MATASRWSASERGSGHPSAETSDQPPGDVGGSAIRAQASPTAALVAVAAIGIGLSLYATILAGVAPTPDQDVAGPTLERVHDAVTSAGVADPEQLSEAVGAGPAGYDLQITLSVDNSRWTAGAKPPGQAENGVHPETETATRWVAVRTSPGTVAAGRLQVVVWR